MLTLIQAEAAISAAKAKASELGITVSISVVDEHGEIIALSRMDGAIVISPAFACTKAYTSAVLGMPTHNLQPYAAEDKPYFGINTLLSGKLTTIAGGVPIIVAGMRIGAIGVGGSSDTSQDLQCAQAGVGVFK